MRQEDDHAAAPSLAARRNYRAAAADDDAAALYDNADPAKPLPCSLPAGAAARRLETVVRRGQLKKEGLA